MLRTNDGRECIDGLSCLWNVNIGHGRKELADAAQTADGEARLRLAPMPASPTSRRSAWPSGSSAHAYGNSAAVYFTTGGAESNESAFKFARYYWKRMGKPNKVKIISRVYGYHGVTLRRDERHQPARLPEDVRPPGAGVPPGRAALPVSLARQRRRRHRRGGRGRGGDPRARRRHHRRGHRRAGDGRRRRHRAARHAISLACARSATATTCC